MAAPLDLNGYWLVAVPEDAPTSGFVRVPIDAYQQAIRIGDVAWIRRLAPDGLDVVSAFGFCQEPVREGRTWYLQIDLQPPWSQPMTLTPQSELWSLVFFRDPGRPIHGVSARETALILERAAKEMPTPPPAPDAGRASGTVDEILSVATDLARRSQEGTEDRSLQKQAAERDETGGVDTAGVVTKDDLVDVFAGLGQLFPDRFPLAGSYASASLAGLEVDISTYFKEVAEKVRKVLVLSSADAGRENLWASGLGEGFPLLGDELADVLALTDALSRRLPVGPAATDAHLVVAMVAADAATDAGGNAAALEALIETITEGVDRDTAAMWRAAAGLPAAPPTIAAIAPDSAEGVDRLDRMPDITALANVIAARSLQPPLSIGVFGEWGAGKTFFMRKLRDEIDRINGHVEDLSKKERIGYCERIAQVEFNAWHYAETDLWSSLIHHLLANLAVGQGEDADELTDRLLDELEGAKAEVGQKHADLAEAKEEVKKATAMVDDAQRKLDLAEEEVANARDEDVWEAVQDHPDIQRTVNQIRGRFGASDVGSAAVELYGATSDTIDIVTAGWNVLRLRDEDVRIVGDEVDTKRGKTITLMVLLTVLAIGGALLVEWLSDSQAVAGVLALAGPLAATMTAVASWLRVQNERGDKVVAALRTSRNRLLADQQAELAKHRENVDSAIADLAKAAGTRQAADAEFQEARAAEAAAQAALDAVSTTRRLADFVRSRVASYESHLSLVSAVRRDFEKLGTLLSAIRREADALRDAEDDGGADERSDHEESADGSGLSIDRIVVYIDDLDRCRPQTVVKVLEAVHLLLAFNFVVVVVGVDARWVGRALLRTYPTLLGSREEDAFGEEGAAAADPAAADVDQESDGDGRIALRRELMQRAASEHDYIEKIFQIPYWLEPMSAANTGTLVSSLFGPVSVLGAPQLQEGDSRREDGGDGHQLGAFEVSDDARAAISALQERLDASDAFDPNPIALTVTDREMLFMDVVYPLVSRSPRSAKRFVNVYRVIKAGLDDEALETWVGPGNGPYPSHAATLLLAIVCGAPQSSTAVLGALADCTNETWTQVATAVEDAIDPDAVDELRRWRQTTDTYQDSEWDKMDAAVLKSWLPKVAQYSFRSGHLDL